MSYKTIIYSGLLLMLCLFSCQLLKAQSPAYRQFTDDDGLPSMTVYGIKQDKDGFLWIATTKGICRFDGKEFKKYFIPDMKGQDFPYIFMDETGTPWFYNLAGEVFYVQDDTVRRANVTRPGDDCIIHSFFTTASNIYISWYKRNHILSFRYSRSTPLSYEKYDSSYIYLGYFRSKLIGVKYYPEKEIELFDFNAEKLFSKHEYDLKKTYNYAIGINEIREISSDSFVILTSFIAAIYNSKGIPVKLLELRKFVPALIIYISIIDKYNIFIKTRDSTFIFNLLTSKLSSFSLSNFDINTIFIDKYNRKWISTSNSGLFLISNAIIYTPSNSGINSDAVVNLFLDGNNLLCGHESGSISVLNNLTNQWSKYSDQNAGKVRKILKINSNELIIAYDNKVVILNVKTKKSKPIKNSELIGVKNLYINSKLELIILTRNGIIIYKLDKIGKNIYNAPFKKILNGIRCVDAVELSDTLFIATSLGIYKLFNNEVYKEKLINSVINRLFVFDRNKLWVCTDNEGIYIFQFGRLVCHLNIESGLPSNSVTSVTSINKESVIIGTDNGCFIQTNCRNANFTFDRLDCIPANEIQDLINYKDSVYIGTAKGLVLVSKVNLQPNIEKPLIYVNSLVSYSSDGEIKVDGPLKYYQNHVRVSFGTRSLLSSEKLGIWYRLIGNDSKWMNTKNNFVEFVALNSDKYNLELKAVNEDGIESENLISLNFEILRPWWEAIWLNAYLLSLAIILLVVGIVLVVILIRLKYKRKAKIVDQINQLKLESLQNQMNPHFIFNALNAIQGFLGFKDEEKAMKYMSELGKLMRIIFEQSKVKSISLEQEFELLWSYIRLEELRFGADFEVKFIVDPILDLNEEYIKIPPLLIQPILENSFRHGLMHTKAKGFVSIEFKYVDECIVCIVEDNGIGRLESRKINEWKRKNHVSTGIASAAERIRIIDKAMGLLSIDIEDIRDLVGKSSGTRTTIVLQMVDKNELVTL